MRDCLLMVFANKQDLPGCEWFLLDLCLLSGSCVGVAWEGTAKGKAWSGRARCSAHAGLLGFLVREGGSQWDLWSRIRQDDSWISGERGICPPYVQPARWYEQRHDCHGWSDMACPSHNENDISRIETSLRLSCEAQKLTNSNVACGSHREAWSAQDEGTVVVCAPKVSFHSQF